jgi:hypothetical protein
MASTTYDINVNTTQAQQALNKLQTQLNKTSDVFGGLKTAIAGLALGAAIKSAINYADAIQDISDATGQSVANVLGFSRAVEANGGDATKANAALLRFTLTIGDAAAGSLAAQDAFAQVGVTLTDLQTLSDQDVFAKTLEGLGKITDLAQRSKLANELLGKAIKGVNISGVAQSYNSAVLAAQKYAKSVESAAAVQDKLDRAFGNLQLSILKALEPLANFVGNLDPDKIEKFIDAVVKIGGAAVAFTALSKAVSGLGTLLLWVGGAVALVGTSMLSLQKTGNFLTYTFKNIGKAIVAAFSGGAITGPKSVASAFAMLGKNIRFLVVGLSQLAVGFSVVALAVVGLNELIDLAFDVNPVMSMGDALEELVTKYLPGLANFINSIGSALGLADSKLTKQANMGPPKSAMEDATKREAKENAITDALAKQRREIERIGEQYSNAVGSKAEQLQLEFALIGASEAQREQVTALIDLDKKRQDEIEKIRQAIANLTEEQKRGGLAQEYEKQIAVIEDITRAEEERITSLLAGLNQARGAQQFRLFQLDRERDLVDELQNIQDEIAKSTMSDIEQKYYDIERAANRAALAAIRAEEARTGVKLPIAEQRKYYEEAIKGSDKLKAKQRELFEQSRTFSSGWRKAFNEYVDNAMNAARNAENLFNKFFSGLEDMLIDFVKTGEFNWKTFLNSMLEELLRTQIRETFAAIMTGVTESFGQQTGIMGSILGSLGGMFGGGGNTKGSSANNPLYVIDISGGAAGGIMGPPTSAMGGGIFETVKSAGSAIWDTVSSIGSSIGDFFGGFFANGGTLGAGKFGIAGERGPEIISGPATITPMGMGGTTNVYYTINAVDTRSFQQLLATDPSLIYALTQQGAKTVGGRR